MNLWKRSLAVGALTVGLVVSGEALVTSPPVISATEVIVVPDVLTGEPMELEVEKKPEASSNAAAYMHLNCSRRYSEGTEAEISGRGWRPHYCGTRIGSGGNSVLRVRDSSGPICVYYETTLAGCASIGRAAWVGNRSGYTGTVRTQSVRS